MTPGQLALAFAVVLAVFVLPAAWPLVSSKRPRREVMPSLSLSRLAGQTVRIYVEGVEVAVKVVSIDRRGVVLNIVAPEEVEVQREEIDPRYRRNCP